MSRSLIGTRIREKRRSQKISQTALADMVGISASYLNLIEHNRRGIAGKTLLSLAKALDINPAYLTEGADQGLVDRIKKAATKNNTVQSEIVRTEEFIGRFPGFASLIENLFDQIEIQEQNLQALSDKISNDPFFAEAIHLMLSTITTISSTADILKHNRDITEERQIKFLSNLLGESTRLTKTAKDILHHFEPSQKSLERDKDENIIEAYMEANDFHLTTLEESNTTPEDMVNELLISKDKKERSLKVLKNYAAMTKALPLDDFLKSAKELNFNPLLLAKKFNTSLFLTFFRLSHLPPKAEHPNFGIIECDGSGAVLYRKQLPTFSLPRYSSACPLWPVYRALSQPMQPFCATINMPTGERFLTYSGAEIIDPGEFGIPGRLKTAMIFTQDYAKLTTKAELSSLPSISVGLQCSVCPRENCPARRNGYILG